MPRSYLSNLCFWNSFALGLGSGDSRGVLAACRISDVKAECGLTLGGHGFIKGTKIEVGNEEREVPNRSKRYLIVSALASDFINLGNLRFAQS